MTKKFTILIFIALVFLAAVLLFQLAPSGTEFLWKISGEGTWLLPLVGVAALIDSINPCAFSILLLTIAFLFSIGGLRRRILSIGSAYIVGIFAAYLLIGLGILGALHIFSTPHFMGRLGALLLISLGLINIINEFFPSFPIKLRIPRAAHHKIAELMERASIPTALALGGLVGLCEFPCTGGPYLMVLGLLHDTRTYFAGFGYLVLYNLVFILPLVIILLIASDRSLLDKVQVWQKSENRLMRLGGGAAMIMLGIIIFFL